MNGAKHRSTLLPREILYHALRDREWHRVEDIWEQLSSLVPPEDAAKFFRAKVKHPHQYPETYHVTHGRKLLVSHSLSASAGVNGRIEFSGPRMGPERRARLIGWFCASCGTMIPDSWESRPAHSCCKPCVDGGTPCENLD